MIDMGTTRPDPSLRVANVDSYMTPPGFAVPGVADISSVPNGPDWAYYNTICTTGWSSDGGISDIKTKCGWADNTVGGQDTCATNWCGIRAYSGNIIAAVDAGASGSTVWQPKSDGTIRLLGFISNCSVTIPCSAGYFRPIYLFATYNWAASETAPGYPTGVGGQVVTGS